MDSKTQTLNRRIHYLFGGLVFFISLIVYFRSVAPTTSFWDCGEFIACSSILGVMHPPGAPLYLLIGRLMTMSPFFGDIGLRVNLFSVVISAVTVFLAYLIIVKLIRRWRGDARTWEDRLIIFVSGAFGALAFAFTDSFWFNAVEAEVYAFSMFFTALVVWLALLWGERSQKEGNLLLIFFIFYMFSLATGVHLLNILIFPFVLLIAYFHENRTVKRLLLLLFVQAAVPLLLYVIFFQFDMNQLTGDFREHQASASKFLIIFGLIWVVVTLIFMYNKDKKVFNAWWVIPVLAIVGYSTYFVIFVRAGLSPPINENDPSTAGAMMDYLARKQYGEHDQLLTFFSRQADFWHYQIHKMYTRYFGWQFIGRGTLMDSRDRIVDIINLRGLLGLPFLVGLWGAIHHFFRDRKRAIAVLVLFFLTGYAIVLYLNQPDPQPRERDYSYVGSFFAFSIWIGIGMAGILEWLSQMLRTRRWNLKVVVYGAAVVLLVVAVPLRLYSFNSKSHSRKGNYVAWDYSHNLLETCEDGAILFTNGDNDTFPLWYLQEVEGFRKDVRVVNLSLLNTPWYIKQLRDQEPKVPINLTDAKIDALSPERWETKLMHITIPDSIRKIEIESRRAVMDSLDEQQVERKLSFTVAPTYPENNPQVKPYILRIQDKMVRLILEENKWEKPIYFAVTVSRNNMIGLYRHLRMDGLGYRITPYPVQREIDPEKLRENLEEKFKYRNLNNPDVYYNTNIQKLLQNYRSAFIQLVHYYISQGRREEARQTLNLMSIKIPPDKIPYSHDRLALAVAELYGMLENIEIAEDHKKYIIPGIDINPAERALLYSNYEMGMRDWNKAEVILKGYFDDNVFSIEVFDALLRLWLNTKQFDQAIFVLNDLKTTIRGIPKIDEKLELFRRLKAEEDSASPIVP